MKKTNAMRILESMGVAFRVEEYKVSADNLSAQSVAVKIGMPLARIFKTLVTQGKDGHYFAVLPGDGELDPKKLARLAGERKVWMAPLKEIQRLTGYIRGGVTVFGAKKSFPVYVHETATDHDEISVSAGVRGMQLILDPRDYLRATAGRLGDLVI